MHVCLRAIISAGYESGSAPPVAELVGWSGNESAASPRHTTASRSTWREDTMILQHKYTTNLQLVIMALLRRLNSVIYWQRHKPELLSEVGSEVLSQPAVVLQAGQQEATALEQQNRLNGTQNRLLRVWQTQHHLLGLVTNEGQLQREEDTSYSSY